MLVTIVSYFLFSYPVHLQMGTDTSLDDLSSSLAYTAERSCLTAIFWWDTNSVHQGLPHLQIYPNLHSNMPFWLPFCADSDLKGNPLDHCYTDKVRVTPRPSFCTWQLCRNESQGTSADSSSSSYPCRECLCTSTGVRRRHLKLQFDPFMCGL